MIMKMARAKQAARKNRWIIEFGYTIPESAA